MNPQIFREYDIRGLVASDLTPQAVLLIARAIGTIVRRNGGKTVTVGRDMRESSPAIFKAVCEGLLSTGCDVWDIGKTPTPVSYFSLYHLNPDGGIMITGSHNPPEFNGLKISLGKHSLYGQRIQEIREMILREDFESGEGSVEAHDVNAAYIEKIKSSIQIPRKVKFVADGGNGCFGLVGLEVFQACGQDPIPLYCEPDGTFPNHHPDPTVEKNLLDLMALVKKEGAELGFGFDGDADRIGVVDENGNVIWGDQLLILFGREILKNHPGASIVGEVKCSQNFFQDMEKRGGKAIMSAAGHSLIKNKMRETNALLAGEMSGHVCFADRYYGFDDATYAACRVLEIVANTDQPLSELLADLPKTVSTPEIRIDCPDDKKFEVVAELTEYFRTQYDVVDIDGVRVDFGDGWALMRASNTQPVMVLRFEAKTQVRLQELIAIVRGALEPYRKFIQLPETL
ncbi:MAG: phosphomannomutase/phosphoglucomutase [Candidatus Nitrohelix vancouverensis]|uniref:Phosphomannomutase/phosphoglucomutase n=1 Tax=Candidatus Nitrohelix vancouverensis TaxID=2705534 RepID=A0A7T0G4W7_9BACT|nr:MAG: phosphomannomutase/phosphoglucomutase [Candidatus Nitrohelix vancouverensis]